MWTAIVIGALVAPSVVASPPIDHRLEQRFTLIESGGGWAIDVENTTTFSAVYREGKTTWFVERNSNGSNSCGRLGNGRCIQTRTSSMDWIDGRHCAPLRGILMQLERVRAKERGSVHPWPSDTPLLSLLMFERGEMATERLAEYSGTLVDWWRSSQERLKPCWTKTRPHDL